MTSVGECFIIRDRKVEDILGRDENEGV